MSAEMGLWNCSIVSKSRDLETRSVFVDPEGNIVVLDVNSSDGGAFRMVTVYALTGAEQTNYFKHLKFFLRTSRTS